MRILVVLDSTSNEVWSTLYYDKSCNMRFYKTCRSIVWLGLRNYSFCVVYPRIWHRLKGEKNKLFFSFRPISFPGFPNRRLLKIPTLIRRLLSTSVHWFVFSFDSAFVAYHGCWKYPIIKYFLSYVRSTFLKILQKINRGIIPSWNNILFLSSAGVGFYTQIYKMQG